MNKSIFISRKIRNESVNKSKCKQTSPIKIWFTILISLNPSALMNNQPQPDSNYTTKTHQNKKGRNFKSPSRKVTVTKSHISKSHKTTALIRATLLMNFTFTSACFRRSAIASNSIKVRVNPKNKFPTPHYQSHSAYEAFEAEAMKQQNYHKSKFVELFVSHCCIISSVFSCDFKINFIINSPLFG